MANLDTLQSQIAKATHSISTLSNNFKINEIVENIITDITGAEYASIWMQNGQLLHRERAGSVVNEVSMQLKKGLLYRCFATKEIGIYNYLTSEKGYDVSIDNPDNIRLKSKIMIPLVDNGKFLGIVTAYSTIRKIKKFTKDDLDVFKAITPFIISVVYKMQANLGSDADNEKRLNDDLVDNLKEIKDSEANKKAPKEVLEYVSNIVHDIRTPANSLCGFLEILQEQIKDERLQEYIEHAQSSALMINELTTSILDGISEQREPTLKEPTVVNSTKFFSDIAEVFSANMSKKQVDYNIFIDPCLPKEIELDSAKMKRVLMNLISNAIKFTPENGNIEFSVRYKQKEKKLHVFVKDSGIGIVKDKQEEIFEAFKQAEDNTKDLYGGTGLGLSICAAYVKEMGGKLSIDSEIDKGSTFYFDIPMEVKKYVKKFELIVNDNINVAILMNKDDSFVVKHISRYLTKIGIVSDKIKTCDSIENIPSNTTHLITFEKKLCSDLFVYVKKHNIKSLVVEENFLSLNPYNLDGSALISKYGYYGDSLYSFISVKEIPRVLIVEDDKISVVLLKAIFANEYCEVDVAYNGEDGLSLLKDSLYQNTPYDILYTDHGMPLLSGVEMLRRYKDLEKQTAYKTKTVSISGDISDDADKLLFDYFAIKPFKKDEIISIFLDSIKQKGE